MGRKSSLFIVSMRLFVCSAFLDLWKGKAGWLWSHHSLLFVNYRWEHHQDHRLQSVFGSCGKIETWARGCRQYSFWRQSRRGGSDDIWRGHAKDRRVPGEKEEERATPTNLYRLKCFPSYWQIERIICYLYCGTLHCIQTCGQSYALSFYTSTHSWLSVHPVITV